MTNRPKLTAIAARAEASQLLVGAGYRRSDRSLSSGAEPVRVFEDPYGVVALHVFETYRDLLDRWTDAQADLVDIISEHWERGEAKSWDGYLLLLTPELALERYDEVQQIRYHTSRVRKIVGVGEDFETLGQVEQVLMPLLPISAPDGAFDSESLIDELPVLLGDDQLPAEAVSRAIDAYREGRPILETLDAWRAQR